VCSSDMRLSKMYFAKLSHPYASRCAASMTNSASSSSSTMAKMIRPGCFKRMARIGSAVLAPSGGTVSRAAGRFDSDDDTRSAGGRRVDRDRVDGAGVDAPLGQDVEVGAVIDERLQRGLDGLRKRRALVDGDAVRGDVEGVTGELDLVLELRDRVLRDRRVRRHRVGLPEGERVAGLVLLLVLEDVDRLLAGVDALLRLGGQLIRLLVGGRLNRDGETARVRRVDAAADGLSPLDAGLAVVNVVV